MFSSRLIRMLRHLAGVSEEVINRAPESERRKFISIGFAMFIPPFVGGITIGYLIYTFYNNPYVAWGISFLIWSPIILIIDQALIGTFRKPNTENRTFSKSLMYIRSIVPRMFIAILLGSIMAVPAELLIFHGPIQNHIKVEHQKQLDSVREKYFTKNKKLRGKISKLQNQIDQKRRKFNQFSYLYSNEVHGNEVSVGQYSTSGIQGEGVQSDQFQQMKNQAKEGLEEIKSQNNPVINKLRTQISENRELMKEDIKGLKQTQSTSFLYQMKALQDLSKDYTAIKFFKWVVLAMVLCLETLPVFVRATASKGMYDEEVNTSEYEANIEYRARRESKKHSYDELLKLYAEESTMENAKNSCERRIDSISEFVNYHKDKYEDQEKEDSEVRNKLHESFIKIMDKLNSYI